SGFMRQGTYRRNAGCRLVCLRKGDPMRHLHAAPEVNSGAAIEAGGSRPPSPWTRMYRPVTACTVAALALASVSAASVAGASETIPSVAWKRAMGLPLENPGREKPSITYPHVDDGYWQGAPVGGLGAGTFSRSYRGDFVRWHLKAGAHKYQPVP